MSEWARILGAGILAALAWIFLVTPAFGALTSNTSTDYTTPSLLAIVDNDGTLSARGSTTMVDVDPSSAGTERIFIGLTFGTALEDANSTRPQEDYETLPIRRVEAESDDPQDDVKPRYGQTVVLLGPLADGIRSCDDPTVSISRHLEFSALSDGEKTAVLNYLTGRVGALAAGEAALPADNEQLYDTPGDVAYQLRYTTLQPRVFYAQDLGFESLEGEDGEVRTYTAFSNGFTCDFDGQALWSQVNNQRVFTFPQQTITSSGISAETVVKVERTITNVSSANFQHLSTEGSSSELEGGIDKITDSETVWDSPLAHTSTPAVVVRYADVAEDKHRELLIFLGGVGLSVFVASVLAVLRTTVVAGLPWIVRRLTAWWRRVIARAKANS